MGAAPSSDAEPAAVAASPDGSPEPDVARAALHVTIAFGGADYGHPRRGKAYVKAHRLSQTLYMAFKAAVWALLLLSFFEQPVWMFSHVNPERALSRDDLYPRFGLPILSRKLSLPLEWFLLLLISGWCGLRAYALGPRAYLRNRRSAVFVTALGLALVDTAVTSICLIRGVRMYRVCSYLRLTMLVLEMPDIVRQLKLVVRALPGLTGVTIAYIVFLMVSAFFSLLLFTGEQRAAVFPNFFEALFNLLILLTTSNFPDVMMPAYTAHRSAFFFFFAFLLIGYFFLTNLILAVVCKGHQDQREADQAAEEASEKENLSRAFALLDSTGAGEVQRPVMKELFDELSANKVAVMSEEREALLWESLDEDMSGTVDEAEFSTVCLLLRVRFSRVSTSTLLLRTFPSLGHSRCYGGVEAFVTGKVLDVIIDLVLVANAIVVAVEITLGEGGIRASDAGSSDAATHWFDGLDICFTCIFFVEFAVKLLVFGWSRYSASLKNCLDGVVTITSIVTMVVVLIPNNGMDDPVALRRVMALRVLRLLRTLVHVPFLPPIVGTFMRMLRPAGTLLSLMMTVMYFFATLGVQLFGGLVNKDDERREYALLKEVGFGQAGYWPNNFNDIVSGIVVCFELIMVNNWMVIAEGFAVVASKWSRLFFVSFYVVGVLISLNIVTAFALDAFMDFYDNQDSAAAEEQAALDEDVLPRHSFSDGGVLVAVKKDGGSRPDKVLKMNLDHVPEEQRAQVRQRLARASSRGKRRGEA